MDIKLPRGVQKHLNEILEKDEAVVDILKEPWSYTKWYRWSILTSSRLILIIRWPFGLSYDVWPLYLRALSIDMNEGFVFDTIYVDYFGQKFRLQFFKKHRKETIRFFCEVNQRFMMFNPSVAGEEEKSAKEAVHELDNLSKIFYHNKMTKEEYDKKRKEMIDKL